MPRKKRANYNEWINRERRIRIRLLRDSPVIRETKTCSVCQDCGEICLCHEIACPNCNSDKVIQQKVSNVVEEGAGHIRCRFRFEQLMKLV